MVYATPTEIEILISNLQLAELPGNWKEEGNKQSLFLVMEIGNVYVRSSTQSGVDTQAAWKDEILKLHISKKHWTDPEALMQNETQRRTAAEHQIESSVRAPPP